MTPAQFLTRVKRNEIPPVCLFLGQEGYNRRLCREALGRIYLNEGVRAAYRIGEYWDKRVQIDAVGLRHDNWIDLGECKWGSVPSVPELIAELEAKVRLYPNTNNATLGRMIFTRRAVKAAMQRNPVRFFSLEDLYAMG